MHSQAFNAISIVISLMSPLVVQAQLQVVPAPVTQALFAGQPQLVRVTFHNPAETPVEMELRTRLYQASSATAMPLGEPQNWKKIEVLPGQTVLESANLIFPAVNATTRFLVQWIGGTNKVLGTTVVMAYPPGVLNELRSLSGDQPLGVLDPQNQLKPLLRAAAVEFHDLGVYGVEDFRAKLVIAGPFESPTQMRAGLAQALDSIALRGAGVVWIQCPTGEPTEEFVPSFYAVSKGSGGIVVAQAGVVANLPENPQAQLNLVQLARLALHPQPFPLPDLASKP